MLYLVCKRESQLLHTTMNSVVKKGGEGVGIFPLQLLWVLEVASVFEGLRSRIGPTDDLRGNTRCRIVNYSNER